MALPSTIQDRDFRNFEDNGDGTTSRLVRITGGSGGVSDVFIDGGSASAVYTIEQSLDGGSAATF